MTFIDLSAYKLGFGGVEPKERWDYIMEYVRYFLLIFLCFYALNTLGATLIVLNQERAWRDCDQTEIPDILRELREYPSLSRINELINMLRFKHLKDCLVGYYQLPRNLHFGSYLMKCLTADAIDICSLRISYLIISQAFALALVGCAKYIGVNYIIILTICPVLIFIGAFLLYRSLNNAYDSISCVQFKNGTPPFVSFGAFDVESSKDDIIIACLYSNLSSPFLRNANSKDGNNNTSTGKKGGKSSKSAADTKKKVVSKLINRQESLFPLKIQNIKRILRFMFISISVFQSLFVNSIFEDEDFFVIDNISVALPTCLTVALVFFLVAFFIFPSCILHFTITTCTCEIIRIEELSQTIQEFYAVHLSSSKRLYSWIKIKSCLEDLEELIHTTPLQNLIGPRLFTLPDSLIKPFDLLMTAHESEPGRGLSPSELGCALMAFGIPFELKDSLIDDIFALKSGRSLGSMRLGEQNWHRPAIGPYGKYLRIPYQIWKMKVQKMTISQWLMNENAQPQLLAEYVEAERLRIQLETDKVQAERKKLAEIKKKESQKEVIKSKSKFATELADGNDEEEDADMIAGDVDVKKKTDSVLKDKKNTKTSEDKKTKNAVDDDDSKFRISKIEFITVLIYLATWDKKCDVEIMSDYLERHFSDGNDKISLRDFCFRARRSFGVYVNPIDFLSILAISGVLPFCDRKNKWLGMGGADHILPDTIRTYLTTNHASISYFDWRSSLQGFNWREHINAVAKASVTNIGASFDDDNVSQNSATTADTTIVQMKANTAASEQAKRAGYMKENDPDELYAPDSAYGICVPLYILRRWLVSIAISEGDLLQNVKINDLTSGLSSALESAKNTAKKSAEDDAKKFGKAASHQYETADIARRQMLGALPVPAYEGFWEKDGRMLPLSPDELKKYRRKFRKGDQSDPPDFDEEDEDPEMIAMHMKYSILYDAFNTRMKDFAELQQKHKALVAEIQDEREEMRKDKLQFGTAIGFAGLLVITNFQCFFPMKEEFANQKARVLFSMKSGLTQFDPEVYLHLPESHVTDSSLFYEGISIATPLNYCTQSKEKMWIRLFGDGFEFGRAQIALADIFKVSTLSGDELQIDVRLDPPEAAGISDTLFDVWYQCKITCKLIPWTKAMDPTVRLELLEPLKQWEDDFGVNDPELEDPTAFLEKSRQRRKRMEKEQEERMSKLRDQAKSLREEYHKRRQDAAFGNASATPASNDNAHADFDVKRAMNQMKSLKGIDKSLTVDEYMNFGTEKSALRSVGIMDALEHTKNSDDPEYDLTIEEMQNLLAGGEVKGYQVQNRGRLRERYINKLLSSAQQAGTLNVFAPIESLEHSIKVEKLRNRPIKLDPRARKVPRTTLAGVEVPELANYDYEEEEEEEDFNGEKFQKKKLDGLIVKTKRLNNSVYGVNHNDEQIKKAEEEHLKQIQLLAEEAGFTKPMNALYLPEKVVFEPKSKGSILPPIARERVMVSTHNISKEALDLDKEITPFNGPPKMKQNETKGAFSDRSDNDDDQSSDADGNNVKDAIANKITPKDQLARQDAAAKRFVELIVNNEEARAARILDVMKSRDNEFDSNNAFEKVVSKEAADELQRVEVLEKFHERREKMGLAKDDYFDFILGGGGDGSERSVGHSSPKMGGGRGKRSAEEGESQMSSKLDGWSEAESGTSNKTGGQAAKGRKRKFEELKETNMVRHLRERIVSTKGGGVNKADAAILDAKDEISLRQKDGEEEFFLKMATKHDQRFNNEYNKLRYKSRK